MDLLDNNINKRLMNGFFPIEKLYAVEREDVSPQDLGACSQRGIEILKENPELMRFLLNNFAIQNKKRAELPEEIYIDEINILINTGYNENDINPKLVQKIINMPTVVTMVDKIFWYGIYVYKTENQIRPDKNNQDMMFAWLYLFNVIQKKEKEYGVSININSLLSENNIVTLIESNWSQSKENLFVHLSDVEIQKIDKIEEEREIIGKEIAIDNNNAKTFAKRTSGEWKIFIDILNDLSKREREVVYKINHESSQKDKQRAIFEYRSVLNNIERGEYRIGEKTIKLVELTDVIGERRRTANAYCCVETQTEKPFVIHPFADILTIVPQKTFNYLFILFHQFRFTPQKDTAKEFLSACLSVLNKNLGIKEKETTSIDDAVYEFNKTLTEFFEKNKDSIARLSFKKLQKEIAVVSPEASTNDIDYQMEQLREKVEFVENDKEMADSIEKMILEGKEIEAVETLCNMLQITPKKEYELEEEGKIRNIVNSTNIIYLFCEALRIITTNKHANIKVDNTEKIKTYRNNLLKIIKEIDFMSYRNLNKEEMSVDEYREENGFDTKSMTEQEMEEETFRNNEFAESFKNTIEVIIKNINNSNNDQIISIKNEIKEEFKSFPECEEKTRYADWLDEISQKICDALVDNCQSEKEFLNYKDAVIMSIGKCSNTLPAATINSLTTAEMLFSKYANEEYAKNEFDYSCISALYYQAIEEAYNALIWKGYSDILNNLKINGKNLQIFYLRTNIKK